MKNRTLIGIVCIILAVAVMFGIAPILNRMASGKMEVIQLSKRIEQGQIIKAEDIVKVQIGKYGVSDSVIKDEKQIIGKYAADAIHADINLFPDMFKTTADSADDVFKTLNGTKQAISVTIDSFGNALSAKLKNGDIVSIIVIDESESRIPAELTYVKVITTTTAAGTDSDKLIANEDGTYELPSTVTLLVNPTQAKLLALFDSEAKLHFSLVYRGDETNAAKFLEAQEKIFTESEAKTDE